MRMLRYVVQRVAAGPHATDSGSNPQTAKLSGTGRRVPYVSADSGECEGLLGATLVLPLGGDGCCLADTNAELAHTHN